MQQKGTTTQYIDTIYKGGVYGLYGGNYLQSRVINKRRLQSTPFVQDVHCSMRPHFQRILHAVLPLASTGAHLKIFTREDQVELFLSSIGVRRRRVCQKSSKFIVYMIFMVKLQGKRNRHVTYARGKLDDDPVRS